MRTLIMLCFLLAGCSADQSVTKPDEAPRPPFEFRNAIAGKTTVDQALAMKLVQDCQNDLTSKLDVTCELHGNADHYDMPIIADILMGNNFVSFKNGVLHGINADFNEVNFNDMVSAMKQAYGSPCKTEQEVLQNGFGAKFVSDKIQWCFESGRLLLTRHNETDVRSSEFSYWTYEQPSPQKQFNSDNI